jgi:hypothetical protein
MILLAAILTTTCTLHPLQKERVWDATEIYTEELMEYADEAKDIYMRSEMRNPDMYRALGEIQFYSRVVADLQRKLRDSERGE